MVNVARSVAAPKSVTIRRLDWPTRKYAELDQNQVNLSVGSCRLVEVNKPGMPVLVEQDVTEVRITVTGNARSGCPKRFEFSGHSVEPHETRTMFVPEVCQPIGLATIICIFLEPERSEVLIQLPESTSGVLARSLNPAPNGGDGSRWAVFVQNSENFPQVTPLVRSKTGGHRVVTVNPSAHRNKGFPSFAPRYSGPCQSRCDDTGKAVAGHGGCESEPIATVALGCFHSPTSTAVINDPPQGGGRVEPS